MLALAAATSAAAPVTPAKLEWRCAPAFVTSA
jgi:hypothetical protein